MGCFLGCFGAPKGRKRRSPAIKTVPRDQVLACYKPLQPSVPPKQPIEEVVDDSPPDLSVPPKQPIEEVVDDSPPDLREDLKQPSFSSSSRKKVTFDLNVKTIPVVSVHEDQEYSSEEDEGRDAVKEEGKPQEGEGSSTPTLGDYPLSHRYQNCVGSDEEEWQEEEEECEECDFDEEDDEVDIVGNEEEESYDSYFSLPMEKERRIVQEINSPKPVRASSPEKQVVILANCGARDRSQYVHSVLNPVENLQQWKELKVRAAPLKHPMKENINLEQATKITLSSETTTEIRKSRSPDGSNLRSNSQTKQEISVAASLSNWLGSSEMAPMEEGHRNAVLVSPIHH